MPLNLETARDHLKNFNFKGLFIEELGWSKFHSQTKSVIIKDEKFQLSPVAELSGVVVFEVTAPDGGIPNAKILQAVHKDVSRAHHENLLIFVDRARTASLWYWVKREGSRRHPREHHYFKGQAGDLILSKLHGMVVELSEFDDDGSVPVLQVLRKVQDALDIQPVTKKFYAEFKAFHTDFVERIEGIDNESDRRWYASVLINRLMFIWFLQKKPGRFIDNNLNYLPDKLTESKKQGKNRFYSKFLDWLFFQGFALREKQRPKDVRDALGTIPYLNGGLFLRHRLENEYKGRIRIADTAFESLFALFSKFSWHLDDRPSGKDENEINPDVLGYIFEKYINQKQFGAYYTRTEITEYLCQRTIHEIIRQRLNERLGRSYSRMEDALVGADREVCRTLLGKDGILASLSILDPACGSGAFLIAAMKTLVNIQSAILGRIDFLREKELAEFKAELGRHRSVAYEIKKRIITDNLFGVDLMEEATEICKLRLFLALVASVDTPDQLEPLPNVDFNIYAGNSLIGLIRVKDADAGFFMQPKAYREKVNEKNKQISQYRHMSQSATVEEIEALREQVEATLKDLRPKLHNLLHQHWSHLGIFFQQAQKNGKFKKRSLEVEDIQDLHPFHWGFEFDQVIQERGGFDVIITNPPWEVLQTDEKEFFAVLVDGPLRNHPQVQRILANHAAITKKTLDIKNWAKLRNDLLRIPEAEAEWLSYVSRFPHQSAFFKKADQYRNQRSEMDGKSVARKINLYALFVEQCFNLLRPLGLCGIVIPSGIYTDLGAKQIREMLFSQTRLTGLFGFENRKTIFEGVDSRFKFVVLTFEKGGKTKEFPAAFMRLNVADLESFPSSDGLRLPVELIRRFSPDSLSVMEFKDEADIAIVQKMLRFPLLGQKLSGKWNVKLTQEFNMTSDSDLFHTKPAKSRLPLFTGKMFHQFQLTGEKSGYWIDEQEGRSRLLDAKTQGHISPVDYESYRWVHRRIASNTNERTMITTLTPPNVFTEVNSTTIKVKESGISNSEMLFFSGVMNGFTLDWYLRLIITTTINMFYVYQLPVPRLSKGEPYFSEIVSRAARLICTTPEYDDLAREVGLGSHINGATDPAERARLRAELDGLVAHLYGLTEDEFAYILTTFPLVAQEVKDAAKAAYRELAATRDDSEIFTLIRGGEGAHLEFKSTARWDLRENKKNPALETVIQKTVAAFLNSEGGSLLIGVADDGKVVGLEPDLQTLKRKDLDGYESFLTDLLHNNLGKDLAPHIKISFHKSGGADICRVTAHPAPHPVYVKESGGEEALYIRTGNSSRKLSVREALDYVRSRWKA